MHPRGAVLVYTGGMKTTETRGRRAGARHLLIAGLLVTMALIILASLSRPNPGPAQAGLRIDADDAALVSEGRVLYLSHCASCHGADLAGAADWQTPLATGAMPAPPHDASGHTWHHDDAYLIAVTREGGAAFTPGRPNGMPGFAGALSDREIIAILSFIASTWPPEIREAQARMNAP
jgi:mono/diheme cytochrome c family protein